MAKKKRSKSKGIDGEPRYFNRELSWLEFNQRVLDEACHPDVPLLERLKFLAITSANLDEFFMVRVGGLQLLRDQGSRKKDPTGLTADEQLTAISARVHRMAMDQYTQYLEVLEPALHEAGIRRLRPSELSQRQATMLEQYVREEVAAILSPMVVTGPDDFPLLVNQRLSVLVRLEADASNHSEPRFAIIPFGQQVARFITLPSEGGYEYCLLEDAVQFFSDCFFPGESIIECVPFRILRNADLRVREDAGWDLLAEMEEVLDARKQSGCVRLEISDRITSISQRFLQDALNVADHNIYAVPGPLDLAAFMQVTGLRGFENLCYEPWSSYAPPQLDETQSIFAAISAKDLLLYHPFDSFDPVVRLLDEAAADPDVLAIKQILYRTSRNSPIVAALRRAAEAGKYVTAILELKARFDEARNIEWAKDLERAGVQVIYGIKGLKTHAKICVVVRREPQGVRRYLHFGTGNYNEATARLYTDASLMTCREELGLDASNFVNAITGYSKPQKFLELAAAPVSLRERILEMIEVEIDQARNGFRAQIMAKLNSLVDPEIIERLYDASQAGVDIRLNIRGICCLRPGQAGLSENIRVVSIIDRYLEHARILYFYHAGDRRVFISSADWMPRNLDRRIELLVPVADADARARLTQILETCMSDNVKGRELLADGSYRINTAGPSPPLRSQQALHEYAAQRSADAEHTRRTLFEPHRAPSVEADLR